MKSIALGALALASLTQIGVTQQLPAIRPLGAVTAVSKEQVGAQTYVRHLKDGVLVNDVVNRRLLKFDSTLNSFTVIADTTPATAMAYGGRVGSLIPYRGDSSLFVDPASSSMLVVDPSGKIQRVMAVPRSQDAMVLGNPAFGTPGFDKGGRLVYRGMPRPNFRDRPANGAFMPPEMPESIAVVRVDLGTRVVDTVGFTKIPKIKLDIQRDDNGRVTVTSQANPLPQVDDWAVLSDGSIALIRGQDYHIDWVRPDGTRESSPKIPFDWKRLTDEDKVAFIDSVKGARARMLAANPPPASNPAGAPAGGAAGGGGAGGPPGEVRIMMGPGGGGPPGAGMMGGREMNFVPANELPDYQPPFLPGSSRADADGNLWIRTILTKAVAGGPVYDVINSKGELVERVQAPKDRTIIGFGPGGVVYLLARDGATARLERAKAK